MQQQEGGGDAYHLKTPKEESIFTLTRLISYLLNYLLLHKHLLRSETYSDNEGKEMHSIANLKRSSQWLFIQRFWGHVHKIQKFKLRWVTKPSTSGQKVSKTQDATTKTTSADHQQCLDIQFTSCSVWASFCNHADRATFAFWGLCGLAVPNILTYYVFTNHRPHFTHTDPTRGWVPDLIVGVDVAFFCAGIFIKKNNWHQCQRLIRSENPGL